VIPKNQSVLRSLFVEKEGERSSSLSFFKRQCSSGQEIIIMTITYCTLDNIKSGEVSENRINISKIASASEKEVC